MSDSGARLIIRHDPTTQQEFPLPTEAVTLGREAINEIVLYDPEVSRRHTEISYQDGRFIVSDLGSTNGTFVNGRRIGGPTPLSDGDVIEMGEGVSITFRGPSAEHLETSIEPPSFVDYDSTTAQPGPLQGPPSQSGEPPPTEVMRPDWQPQVTPGAPVAEATIPRPAADRRRTIMGIGCLIIAVIAICVTTVFLLDQFAADALYCGPAEPIFEIFVSNLFCG